MRMMESTIHTIIIIDLAKCLQNYHWCDSMLDVYTAAVVSGAADLHIMSQLQNYPHVHRK
jgi:hypothetical protein